jgi:hypothetical protein
MTGPDPMSWGFGQQLWDSYSDFLISIYHHTPPNSALVFLYCLSGLYYFIFQKDLFYVRQNTRNYRLGYHNSRRYKRPSGLFMGRCK